MTLAEIYDAIMSVDASVKRIEGNQIEEFERIKARVRTIEDELEEFRNTRVTADQDCHEQISLLRRKYHDLSNRLVPVFAHIEEGKSRGG